MVISLGLEKASKIYAVLIASTYIWVVLSIILRLMPITSLVAFLTLPVALKAVRGTLQHYDDIESLIPAMGANVMLVLSMTGMTTIGLLLSVFLQ